MITVHTDQPGSELKKICRDCRKLKPLDEYHRTPTGRCKLRCAQCEKKHQAAEAKKWHDYASDYYGKSKARKAAAREKWMALAKGDRKAVDWGDER